jgi:4-azaleucine resistance transporter AzlC
MKPSPYTQFLHGAKKGIPIMIGYIPIAIAFGVLARQAHLPLIPTVLMSILVYAGASQFMAVNMLSAGTTGMEIVIATLILNLRHLIMSLSLMNSLPRVPKIWKTFLSFGITDESFAMATLQSSASDGNPFFLFGLFVSAYGAWVLGTGIGATLYAWIPSSVSNSMSIALYAMFIGLLIPAIKASWRKSVIAIASIAVCSFFHLFIHLSMGWAIVLGTLSGSSLGIFLCEEETA